jgi:hypothetical protein
VQPFRTVALLLEGLPNGEHVDQAALLTDRHLGAAKLPQQTRERCCPCDATREQKHE